jgi:Flp pilus assembly protein TadG
MFRVFGSRKSSESAARGNGGGGFLTRLRRDARGNTLAIVGAALVPLSAMIGSGVDMSRAYMAKTRLQSACDAAALAGRRVMTNDTMSETVRAEAVRFFDFNFHQAQYHTTTFTPVVTRPVSGTVRVTAATRIPTSIMSMFGFTSLPLHVTCDASLNFVNTDVMLVLDVTGSMADDVNGNSTSVAANQKITAMRDAVMALYDELSPIQTQLQANGLRLRYGVVPYSSTVNVGGLIRGQNVNFLVDSHDYQSRVANFTTPAYIANTPTTSTYWEYYRGSSSPQVGTLSSQATTAISSANCVKFNQNADFSGYTHLNPVNNGTSAPATRVDYTFPYDNSMTSGGTAGEFGWTGAPVTSGTNRSCRRLRTDTTTTYTTRYSFTSWTYQKVTGVDTSAYRTGSATISSNTSGTTATSGSWNMQQLPSVVTGIGTTTSTWNGCIEERQTVNTITPTTTAMPTGALDLDINQVPTSGTPLARWRPQWPGIEYYRTAGSTTATSGTSVSTAACPAAAVRLTAWNRAAMQTYVNGLTPTGSTYHDIGMLWGTRMLTSAGVFADSPNEFNAMPVSRSIIFMTDGQMDTDPSVYGAYGVERNDARVSGSYSPSETELNGRHLARFKMICTAAKSLNISIWVIAFGTTLSSDMLACASNANQASTVSNRTALIARFREIGNNIGALRLTQ